MVERGEEGGEEVESRNEGGHPVEARRRKIRYRMNA